MSQWRFSGFRRQKFIYLRKFQRQLALINHIRHTILVINRKRFTPITLTRENSVTQTIVYFYTTQLMLLHIFFGYGNSFFDSQSVQVQVAIRSSSCFRRITYDTFFSIEAFFRHITTFYQWNDRQVEVFCKSIVTTIVSRNSHNGSCTISSQYIVADPYWNRFTSKRIHCIRTTEYTGNTAIGDTFTFGTLLSTVQISFHFCFLCLSCQYRNQFTFRSQYHESNTKHSISTSSKDGKFQIAVFYLETYLCTFRTTNPVTLCFFQRISPIYSFQSVEQALSIC